MEGGIFIADSRLFFSQELAAVLRDRTLEVLLTGNKNDEGESIKCKYELEWNRSSIFSLQSLPLQLKNLNKTLAVSVITFDALSYLNLYPATGITDVEHIIEDLVTANVHLTMMLKNYFLNIKQGKMVFVYRSASLPTGNPAVMAASGSFIKMAEEAASSLMQANNQRVHTLLLKLEGKEDEAAALWLANQLESPSFAKMQGKWIRAGQRSIFGKY